MSVCAKGCHGRGFFCAFLLSIALDAIALFDFGSVHSADHLLTPSFRKKTTVCDTDAPESYLNNNVRANIDRIVGLFDDQQDKREAEQELGLEFGDGYLADDPLFNYWTSLHGHSKESRQSYRALTSEQKKQLKEQWSIYQESIMDVLLYGSLIPARGETTGQYRESNRIVPPHIIRLLGNLRMEAAVREWLASKPAKVRGDSYQQELAESESEARKSAATDKKATSSKRKGYTISLTSSFRTGGKAAGSGGGPYKPSGSVVLDFRDKEKARQRYIDATLEKLGLSLVPTKGDHNCMYHAISGQLPVLAYNPQAGLALRDKAAAFLRILQEKGFPPDILVPGVFGAAVDKELFFDWELKNYDETIFTAMKPYRFYLKIISSFKGEAVVPGLPEYTPEYPDDRFTAQRIWGDEAHLTILNQILSFYTVVLSKTSSGIQILVTPPGGRTTYLKKDNLDSVIRLFDKISKVNRTLTASDFSGWFEEEKKILTKKLNATETETSEYGRLSSWLARFGEKPETTLTSAVMERPVILLLYEGDISQPHWSPA